MLPEHVQHDYYIARTELRIHVSQSNYKYFVPPELKIYELYRNDRSS